MSNPQRTLIAVLFAALVVLAGCSGGGTDPATSTATTTTHTEADATTTDDPATAQSVNATAVKLSAVAAMADVETYRIDAHIATLVSSNNVERRTVTDSTGTVDRAERELRINRTARVAGQSSSVSTYVVNRTLYQRSPQFTRAFSSKWISRNFSDNFSQRWSALDTLTRQRELLNISDVEFVGRKTVNGTQTYVLRATPDPERYANLSANVTNRRVGEVRNVSVTYWLSTDTYLPVRSNTTINSTVSVRGRQMDLHQEATLRFSGYGDDVSIRLPPAAETAVSLGDRSNETTTTGADDQSTTTGATA
ncbi:hypothetical protein M0R88_06435 [Halorussus gelatinilyticus]|uniref:Uncharacterized protein n=1 Tax=Halorussus gelatinilyticus TaxID=2937524 RepID=A0A8U0IM61_9EURY|nr:hypothetical protein [Halorussus gelatinilyticus]UPW01735.1 hypothetical protein M0R88_06435 [Halorussus gelatinilyticus]